MTAAAPQPGLTRAREGGAGVLAEAAVSGGYQGRKDAGRACGREEGSRGEGPREMSALARSTSPPGPESLPVRAQIKAQMGGIQPRWSCSAAA